MINFKIDDVVNWLTNNYNMTNISKTKGNQAMKFGHLIKYNTRNVFLEKSNKNVDAKLLPDPFLKQSKLRTPLDQ